MRKKLSLIFTIVCMVLAIGAGWFVCENRMLEKESEYTEQSYELEDIELQNIEQTEIGLQTGIDPQLILTELNSYVETIFLEGLKTQEEIQVFYTEIPEEVFSEAKSVVLVPEQGKDGCIFI